MLCVYYLHGLQNNPRPVALVRNFGYLGLSSLHPNFWASGCARQVSNLSTFSHGGAVRRGWHVRGPKLHKLKDHNFRIMSSTSKSHWDWLPETEALCAKLEAEPGWSHTRSSKTDEELKHLFSRVVTANGPVIHFALFLHDKEGKIRGVCQFGEDANGFIKGAAHGGAIATMHDSSTGMLATRSGERPMYTAYLNTTFKRPVPVCSPVLMEAVIDKVEGKKTFMKAYLKTPDEQVVYSECSALYVDPGWSSESNM